MKPDINSNKFIQLFRRQRQRSIWHRAIAALAVLVVLGVIHYLTMPAITMENEIVCGLEEHTHTHGCYDEVDGENVLICGLSEHSHDERCLAAAQEEETIFFCGFDYSHQHSDACYVDGVQVCTLGEHTHSEICLDPSAPRVSLQAPKVEKPTQQPDASAQAENEDEEDPELSAMTQEEPPITEAVSLDSPENGEYENIRDQENARISFAIQVNQKEVEPAHFYGEGSYTLSISSVELPSYEGTIFYCKLYTRGFTLFAEDDGSLKRLEEFTHQSPGSTASVYYWAQRDADGYYCIYILPKEGSEIVFQVSISGTAVSELSEREISAQKSGSWSAQDLAYRYEAALVLPSYENFRDHAYSFKDWTAISDKGYSPFFGNTKAKDLKFTYQIGSQEVHTLRPIHEVWNDPSAQIAYYQKDDEIYLMNRKTHEGACLVSSPIDGYSDWCACWAQGEETVIRISYVDVYAQNYFVQFPKTVVRNRVTINSLDGRNGQTTQEAFGEVRNVLPAILDKSFNPTNSQCKITLNESRQDLSGYGTLTITDCMKNAVYGGNLTITATNAVKETTTLQPGTDYVLSVSAEKDLFTLELLRPGAYSYAITYNVEKVTGDGGVATNNVEINTTKISKSISIEFDYKVSSNSYGCDVSFIKRYDENNPTVGAEFGLYNANDDLLARSVTTPDGKRVIAKAGKSDTTWGDIVYTIDNGDDRVTFDARAGIRSGQLFYIKEIAAPEGYLLDKTRYYFFVTSHPNEPALTPVTMYQGNPVNVLDNWELRLNPSLPGYYYYYMSYTYDVVFDNFKAYELPETGGSGNVPLLLCGGFLLIAPCLYCLWKKRREQRLTNSCK